MKKGFTLIQMSIILTLAALAMVAVLPGYQTTNNANSLSASKMNALMSALRAYEVAHGNLPCPADPTIATGNGSYGTAAANGGSTGNCMGGSPAAAYADTTKNIAVGMVPVRTLGLSYDAALDGYGRDITYVVDTNSTGCWATSTLQGAVSVTDNGIYANTVVALVSHGADAYGAWLPTQGTGSTGTGQRLNNGSTDTSEAANAEVATGGGLTALTSGNFVSLINRPATSTFDDLVVYKNCFYTLNSLPVNNANATLSTTPANGTYSSGQTLTFTLTFPQTITVTGTPELKLTANSGSGSTSIGSSPYNAGYATYSSGSSTTTLTFSYTVLSTDNAPGGITVTAPIILNGGTISSIASLCLIGKNLPNVILSNSSIYIADGSNNRVVKVTTAGGYLMGFGAGYNGIGGSMGSSGSTNGKLSYAVGIVLDSSGNIWTVDNGNSRIIEYSNSGGFTKNITNSLNDPANMAIDTTGVLWIADEGNNKLQNYNTNTSTWGTAISLGAGYYPYGVAIDKNNNSVIWTISPGNNKCALERCVVGG